MWRIGINDWTGSEPAPDAHSWWARSGKSAFAERLARTSGRSVAFIATATAGDEEMRERIERHRTERPANWLTIEEPLDMVAAVRQGAKVADVIILDCMTLWLTNWLFRDGSIDVDGEMSRPGELFNEEVAREVERLVSAIQELPDSKSLLIVSNEVGLGLVPDTPLGRVYRDILGRINQRIATEADLAYLLVAGLPIELKHLQASYPW
ncbi:bifunctional adenosylcobinamide kinase/adenosylcobinamide-phosphate guanylyltransferase [Ktedonospora formicarum]|uniref:Adenosylcobinamide kinase n=1 Tax=Ktedonospora formicarum TaxID=2778364 RepID=A0A8J3I3Y9_9CHLR|nr:bifunctional adenosylcobinamide kinase/adenosylcobinamide-phosphate guanylyltransferase [Ktedonospora formicarum]GHO46403.1 adenosylcobinamide kinase/adenosylcobinamide phosphate guanyltransferase [Ktedonospora formicarum]